MVWIYCLMCYVTSIILQLSCSVLVNVPQNCKPFLHSHSLWLLSFLFLACYMLWKYYLPLIWHFWVHCIYHLLLVECELFHYWSTYFGSCILCSFKSFAVFCSGSAKACSATLAASSTVWYCFSNIYLLSFYPLYLYFSASMFYNCFCLSIWDFYFWNHVMFLASVKITPDDAYIHLYCYYVNLLY